MPGASNPVVKTCALVNARISPRLNAPAGKSVSLVEGKKLLDRASGISFFFDRDAPPKLAEAANKALVEFMKPPHDIAKVIAALDAASR